MVFLNAVIDIFLDMSLYMLIGMILTGVLSVVMKKADGGKASGRGQQAAGAKSSSTWRSASALFMRSIADHDLS